LWPGSKYTEADRTRAILRAFHFIEQSAEVPENYRTQDSDFLYCFYSIAATAREPELRDAATRAARKYARKFAGIRVKVPPNASVNQIAHLIFGWYPAAMMGENDSRMKAELRRQSGRYSAVDFLKFDPAVEPPPSDISDPCEFDHFENPRGVKLCRKCGRPLAIKSKYEVWIDALVDTYSGDLYGVPMGASYRDAIKWLPAMRPYPDPKSANPTEFLDALYALTHVVYTLNDYGHYRLPRDLLPQEFAYLRANLPQAIAMHDPETMGEFLDALKGFGLDESDPVIQQGMTYLLDNQRPDGTWGPADEADYYTLYHAAWTGIDGLKGCCWQGERLSFPGLRPVIEGVR
jgi:hypothetical protein